MNIPLDNCLVFFILFFVFCFINIDVTYHTQQRVYYPCYYFLEWLESVCLLFISDRKPMTIQFLINLTHIALAKKKVASTTVVLSLLLFLGITWISLFAVFLQTESRDDTAVLINLTHIALAKKKVAMRNGSQLFIIHWHTQAKDTGRKMYVILLLPLPDSFPTSLGTFDPPPHTHN